MENARRLATRMNVVLTVALAFAGAGSKLLIDALADQPRGARPRLVLGAAALGVAFMYWAFVRVLVRRDRGGTAPFASAFLLPPDADEEPDADAALEAYLATSAAAYDLHGRNAEERRRIASAQGWLVVGALLTMVMGALYTLGAGA